MKKHKTPASPNRLKLLQTLLAAAPFLAAVPATLADTAAATTPEPPPEAPFTTGTLALFVDTHFVSYGADVWGAGKDWDDLLFHPSLELGFDLGGGLKAILGTWWDVNDNARSSIGNEVQEIDVWAGFGYSTGDWSFTALYQEWMYNFQSERIVDLKAAHSHFLKPNLTLHFRTDSENQGQDDGLAAVLGIAPGKTFDGAGGLSLSFPVNVAYDTEGFHGGDAGWSFLSAGATASVPLKFISKGNWSFTAGVTYYLTNEDVIPGNPEENFLTGSTGVTLSF
jgi:hypothetical protein